MKQVMTNTGYRFLVWLVPFALGMALSRASE
jgi:hypothetical protein